MKTLRTLSLSLLLLCLTFSACTGLFRDLDEVQFAGSDSSPFCELSGDCGDGERCYRGVCYAECELQSDCASDERCVNLACTPRDCEGIVCETGEACFEGQCLTTCTDLQCGEGEGECNVDAEVCVQPSCNDGLMNGDEIDVDCGGADCGRCDIGQICRTTDDCERGRCDAGKCIGCTDGYIGDGSSTAPYHICTAEQLRRIGTSPANMANHYTVTAQIDLDGVNQSFPMIGSADAPFVGSFDGAGFAIDNLMIDAPDEDQVGFFGQIGSGVAAGHVTDVFLPNAEVSGKSEVGILAGRLDNGTISHSYTDGTVNAAEMFAGGLVGSSDGLVSFSASSAQVVAERAYAGGLVGASLDTSSVQDSFATGAVSSSGDGAGGLVGRANYATIWRSYSSASATLPLEPAEATEGKYAGGLVGLGTDSEIMDCYATGSVVGRTNVGGLAGFLSNTTLTSSYAASVVTYNQGTQDLSGQGGGLIGAVSDMAEPKVVDSYWDGSIDNGIGYTAEHLGDMWNTEAFHAHDKYGDSWNFCTSEGEAPSPTCVWRILDGPLYPKLAWE